MRVLTPLILIAVLAAPVAAGDRPQRPGDDGTNLLVTIVVTDTDTVGATTERTLRTLVADGEHARLSSGWKLPVATTTVEVDDGGGRGTPVTSMQYQDVGISASLQVRTVADGRVRLAGRVEVSGVDDERQRSVHLPQLGAFRHQFDVLLDPEVLTTVAEVPKPDGGTLTVRLSAAPR